MNGGVEALSEHKHRFIIFFTELQNYIFSKYILLTTLKTLNWKIYTWTDLYSICGSPCSGKKYRYPGDGE